jgi:NAD(P)-dependent dehydrogenase (short-subunit alcohol dehydrogenase family)
MIPLGKLALPEHVSAAVVYLASEEAAMVNGTTLSVDGGWTAW